MDDWVILAPKRWKLRAATRVVNERVAELKLSCTLCSCKLAVSSRIDKTVINDYGTKDIYPVLAKCLGWGYGDTGRHKFGRAEVRDRAHDFGHSDFFKKGSGRGEEFVRRFWKPWFETGECVSSEWDEKAASPLWLSILSVLPVQWIACAIATLLFLVFCFGIPKR
jgi:hypothetical protein